MTPPARGRFELLDDVAWADVAFRARGATLEEVFTAAVDATTQVMVDDLASVAPRERREIRLENEALDLLLFDLLEEVVFRKDADGLLLRADGIRVRGEGGRNVLEATLVGEPIDPEQHETRVDVKAVTLHRFALVETDGGWEATVVLDV